MKRIIKDNRIQILLMMLLTIASQLISLYKSIYTATNYGTTSAMDAYNYATNIATFFFDFISSGIATVVLPAYVKKTCRTAIDSFLTIIYAVVVFFMTIVFLFRKEIIQILTNREIAFTQGFCQCLLIVFAIQSCISLLLVSSAFYQANNRFIIPKFINLIANSVLLIVLISNDNMPLKQFFCLVFGAAFINFVVDYIIACRLGFRYRPTLKINNADTKKMLKIFAPTLVSCGVFKMHSFTDTLITANLGVGKLTLLTYAMQISGMITNFAIGTLLTYAYPQIVKGVEDEENDQKELYKFCISFFCIVCLLVVGYIAIGKYGIKLIYGRGKFTNSDINALFIYSAIYLFSQIFLIIRDLIFRYYYAKENTTATVYNSLISSVLNIIVSIVLANFIGVYGVILGTLISGVVSTIGILISMKKNYGIHNAKKYIYEIGKIFIASLITLGIVVIIKGSWIDFGLLFSILVYGMITVLVFAIILKILRSEVWSIKI